MDIRIDLGTLSRLYGDVRYPNILFDSIVIPSKLDKDTFTNELYRKSIGLEVIYPDGKLMMDLLRSFSKKRLGAWEKMVDALASTYNVVENYDRQEDITNTAKVRGSSSTDSNSTDTSKNITATTGLQKQEAPDTSISSNMAYNSGSMVESGKTESTLGDRKSSNTEQRDSTIKSNSTSNGDSTTDSESKTVSRVHGNIGVTTAQTMITEELKLRMMDIIDVICNEIIDNFCIKVW